MHAWVVFRFRELGEFGQFTNLFVKGYTKTYKKISRWNFQTKKIDLNSRILLLGIYSLHCILCRSVEYIYAMRSTNKMIINY